MDGCAYGWSSPLRGWLKHVKAAELIQQQTEIKQPS